jgi:sarcosine oxidase gamma subunit
MLSDRSLRQRFGCKGPTAEHWLRGAGLPPPAGANRWYRLPGGEFVGRLATSEFLVEALGPDCSTVVNARSRCEASDRASGVIPIARQDLVIELTGSRLIGGLRELCSVDFAPIVAVSSSTDGPVILTSMIGVPVVAVAWLRGGAPVVTLWIDPSFAHYFWTTLLQVAADAGSGAAP